MGTEAGRKARVIIDAEADEKLTPSLCLAEKYAKILKTEDEENAELRKAFIKSRSAIIPLNEELAVEAAKTDVAMKKKAQNWGLAASIVLLTVRDRNAKVFTGDPTYADYLRLILSSQIQKRNFLMLGGCDLNTRGLVPLQIFLIYMTGLADEPLPIKERASRIES